jgi:hypothetical protein
LSPGGERLIVDFCAEVAGVDVYDHLARVLRLFQVGPGEFDKRYPFGAGNLDRAVHGRAECHVGDCVKLRRPTR